MNVIENWNLLNARMREQKPELIAPLMQIHMGAFDDLRKGGHTLRVDGKPVAALSATLPAQERLELAGRIGRSLIDAQGSLFEKTFAIRQADDFPNCIFIAAAAIIENLEGGVDAMFPDKKMTVRCSYASLPEKNDPLGKLLPLLEKCYPWVSLSVGTETAEAPAPAAERTISREESGVLLRVGRLARIDTMRMMFGGVVQRGEIRKGDKLNVVDDAGKVLCGEGAVLLLVSGRKPVDYVRQGETVDEMLLSTELPPGKYSAIFLVDGDEAPSRSAEDKAPEKKRGFFSRLFGK